MRFRMLESSKTVVRKAIDAHQLSREAVGHETTARQQQQLLSEFGKIQFQLNNISREAVGREVAAIQQREFLCDKMKKFISLKPFSREALSCELLARQPLNQFLKKNTKMHFEQKHKTREYKITFKQIKHSKNFLGLINKYLSIHITFEHVQSHI